MGTVPLLSREGEIEIAKRIEEGEQIVESNLLARPTPSCLPRESSIEEDRCARAIRGGKRPRGRRPATASPSLQLLEAVEQALADRDEGRKNVRRAKSKKKTIEAEAVLDGAELEDRLVNTADREPSHIASATLWGTSAPSTRSGPMNARSSRWPERPTSPVEDLDARSAVRTKSPSAAAMRWSKRPASPRRCGPASTAACGASSAASGRSRSGSASSVTSSAPHP